MNSGNHRATIVSAEIYEAKSGNIAIKVNLSVDGEPIDWYGWLTNAAMQRTSKALREVVEYDESIELLPEGKISPEAIAVGKMVDIVVESEVYNNKSTFKVKWLNNVRAAKSSSDVLKAKLESIGFKAAYKASKDEMAPITENEIPF